MYHQEISREGGREAREQNTVRQYEKGLLKKNDIETLVREIWGRNAEIQIGAQDIEMNPYICKVTWEKGNVNIFLALENEEFLYKRGDTQEIVARSMPKSAEDYEILESISRQVKVVKSRPPRAYPELMGVAYEELFPKGKKIAIIGDPYMACDFENGTIVECEFGDEIMPDFVQLIAGIEIADRENDGVFEGGRDFYKSIDGEEMDALERIGSIYERPSDTTLGNPYLDAVKNIHEFIGRCGGYLESFLNEIMNDDDFIDAIDLQRERLKDHAGKIKKLIEGDWSLSDYIEYSEYTNAWENIKFYFHRKQRVQSPEARSGQWNEFLQNWNKYIDAIPKEDAVAEIEGFERKLEGVRFWLQELPRTRSEQRIRNGLNSLEDFYFLMLDWGARRSDDAWNNPFYNSVIQDTRSTGMMSDGPFGIDIPGHSLPKRVEDFLRRSIVRATNALTYIEEIAPLLIKERKRIKELAPEMDNETIYRYLKSHERALIKSKIYVQQPKRAVPVRGFFPDQVNIEEQDRIVALTSVTMHGWNRLDKEGFRKNIFDALKFLKKGGKYILGPINQEVYFGKPQGEFDCASLTNALQDLKKEGLINFFFVKGVREEVDYGGDVYEEGPSFSEDDQVLEDGEAAKSLVIERI